jgi:hypothetical protein
MTNPVELDEDHPLWLVNEQINGLLEGLGAPEDHEDVLKFLRNTGLPEDTVSRLHRAIVHGDRKVLPEQSDLLNLMIERKCCGTLYGSHHRGNCPNYRGKKGAEANK